jgi:hypothetical protein
MSAEDRNSPSAHPEMASFGPYLRSRFFAILSVAALRLRLQKRCGLGLNRNLPFLVEHYLKKLNLRAKYNVHIIAIKQLVPESLILVPPAGFVIKDSDILIMLGKSDDIRRIKALK